MCSLSEFLWGVRLFYLIYPAEYMEVSLPWLYPVTPFSTHRFYMLEDSLLFNPGFEKGIFGDSVLYLYPSPIPDGYRSFIVYGEGSPVMKGGGIERPIFSGKIRAWGYLGVYGENEVNYHGEFVHPLPPGSLFLVYHTSPMLSFKSRDVLLFLSPEHWRIWAGGENLVLGVVDGSPALSFYFPLYWNLLHLYGTYRHPSSFLLSLSYFLTENSTLTLSYPQGVAWRSEHVDLFVGRWFWVGIKGENFKLFLRKRENIEMWGSIHGEWSMKEGKINTCVGISFLYGRKKLILISPGVSILGARIYFSLIPEPLSFSYWLYLTFTG